MMEEIALKKLQELLELILRVKKVNNNHIKSKFTLNFISYAQDITNSTNISYVEAKEIVKKNLPDYYTIFTVWEEIYKHKKVDKIDFNNVNTIYEKYKKYIKNFFTEPTDKINIE